MTSRRKTWISALAASLALVALGACSGEEDPRGEPASRPVVPALEQVWTSDALVPHGTVDVLRVDDVVVVEREGLVGLDAATGEERWRLPATKVCAFPERAQDGLVVIGYQRAGKDRWDSCPTLAAVDAATGAVVWKRRIRGVGSRSPVWDRLVAVGDSSVSVKPVVCGPLRRYDLHTGKPLKQLDVVGSDGFACDDWAIDGQWIAQLQTPDFGERNSLVVYDADTGEQAFRRPVRGGRLGQIYSSDPLVIDLSIRGHRLLWRVDPATGELLAPIGGQLSWRNDDLRPRDVVDGVIVATGYPAQDGASPVRAAGLDPTGGPALWSGFPASGTIEGFDRGLVVTSDLPTAEPSSSTVVTRHDAADVTEVEVLGTIEHDNAVALAGDLLLTETETGLAAYRLPTPGKAPRLAGDVDLHWDDDPSVAEVDDDRWQDGEVRPDDVADCALSDETLTTLGFHRLDLPRPVGCDWVERAEPAGTDRSLHVETYVGLAEKAVAGQERLTATERAQDRMEQIREKSMVEGLYDPDQALARRGVALPGVGDEAYLVQGVGIGGREGNISLLVRVANVVVHVDVEELASRPYDASGSVAPYLLEEGAWSAVEELFDAAGLTVERPAVDVPPAPALQPRPDLCRVLGPSAAAFAPGLHATDLRPQDDDQGRVAGCAWTAPQASGNQDTVQVGMYAVPSSTLTGASGEALARQALRYTTRGKGPDRPRPLDGLGDRAAVQSWDKTWLVRSDGVSRFWSAARVMVRDGNLGVVVVVQREGSSTATLEQEGIALARHALATQRP